MSNPITRRTLLAAATATVLAIAIAPLAVCRADSLARVDVYDRSAGEALPVYRHHGRRYVVGEPGNEYAIRIRNCSGRRLLAVVSVDGVNAVTGESASPDQSGYVLEPGGYVNIQGWRKDLSRTAAFYFSDPGDSYASRTGRPDDLGVIGVALFRERPVEQPAWLSQDRQSAAPASRERTEADAAGEAKASRAAGATASAPAMQQPSLGTGHGRGEYSPVAAGRVRARQHATGRDDRHPLRAPRNAGRHGRACRSRGQRSTPPPRPVPGRARVSSPIREPVRLLQPPRRPILHGGCSPRTPSRNHAPTRR